MKHIINWLLITIAVFISAELLPGVEVESFFTAFLVAVVLGAINLFLKPVLLILTLPINIFTLGIFTLVINAGLIMLHPFFESLFGNLKLCKDKKWKDAEGQHKAVLVMQYLCTGSEEFWDSDLFFNKLYCVFNPDSVINTSIALTDNDKTQCDEMLAAVIGHWKKLGNTSIEGLRETFLRRKGKVVLSENELTLNVENSGVDILLEYLPWSIRIVKSPWLDKIINCCWEY